MSPGTGNIGGGDGSLKSDSEISESLKPNSEHWESCTKALTTCSPIQTRRGLP